jgi:hypothetical protein
MNAKNADPEVLFTKMDRIGKGSFGEVFKGCVASSHPYHLVSSQHVLPLLAVELTTSPKTLLPSRLSILRRLMMRLKISSKKSPFWPRYATL